MTGRILELGPAAVPFLDHLPGIAADDKWVIEFPEAMAYCRAKGYRCLEQDLGRERWNLDDGSVDVVVSSQVLEHIPDTDHVMLETRRVLKPGGHVLVSVPNQTALAYVVMMLLTINPPMNMVSDYYHGLGNPFSSRRLLRSAPPAVKAHGHLRLFGMRAMLDLMKVYGFEIIRKHGVTWGLPLVGRALARVWPYYGLFTVVLARKQ